MFFVSGSTCVLLSSVLGVIFSHSTLAFGTHEFCRDLVGIVCCFSCGNPAACMALFELNPRLILVELTRPSIYKTRVCFEVKVGVEFCHRLVWKDAPIPLEFP